MLRMSIRGLSVAMVLTVASGALPAGSGATPPSPAICTYFSPTVVCPQYAAQPPRIVFGNRRFLLEHLRWDSWGSANATAHGILRQQIGRAASRHYTYRQARVTASSIGPCDGTHVYEHLDVAVPGKLTLN